MEEEQWVKDNIERGKKEIRNCYEILLLLSSCSEEKIYLVLSNYYGCYEYDEHEGEILYKIHNDWFDMTSSYPSKMKQEVLEEIFKEKNIND